MTTTLEEADDVIADFRDACPDGFRLARLASPAVKIDTPLLRRLRLHFLAATGAEIEAAVWFSELVQSHSPLGIVLESAVATLLRNDLAQHPGLLSEVYDQLQVAHRDEAESIQLEEHITFLALKTGNDQTLAIEARLQEALRAMRADEQRGAEIARWALRALPRLPANARNTEAAVTLALAAAQYLGGRVPLTVPADRGLPDALPWILNAPSRETRVLGVRGDDQVIEFVEPDTEGAITFELPATKPGFVELLWDANGRTNRQLIQAEPGQRVSRPGSGAPLRLRTLAGDEYALGFQDPTDSEENVSNAIDLEQTPEFEVESEADEPRIRFVRIPLDEGRSGIGYFFSPDQILTAAHFDFLHGNTIALPDHRVSVIEVRPGSSDRQLEAEVIRRDQEFALLQVAERDEHRVRPEFIDPQEDHAGLQWRGFRDQRSQLSGRMPDAIERGIQYDVTIELSAEIQEGILSYCGCPVMLGDQCVGQITFLTDSDSHAQTVSGRSIAEFLERDEPPGRQRVLISSSFADLSEYRESAGKAVEASGMSAIRAENLGATDEDAYSAMIRMVDDSDLFLGIIGWRYGFIPEGQELSIDEVQYNRARDLGKRRLIYLLDEKLMVPEPEVADSSLSRIREFRERLQRENKCHVVASPQQLFETVLSALPGGAKPSGDESSEPPTQLARLVVVSDSSEASEIVDGWRHEFRRIGFEFFSDFDVEAGSQWQDAVDRQLGEADAAILLLTRYESLSGWVRTAVTTLMTRRSSDEQFFVLPIVAGSIKALFSENPELIQLGLNEMQILQLKDTDELPDRKSEILEILQQYGERQTEDSASASPAVTQTMQILSGVPDDILYQVRSSLRPGVTLAKGEQLVRVVAADLIQAGISGLASVVDRLRGELDQAKLLQLRDLIGPAWVNPEAAAVVREISEGHTGNRAMYLNSSSQVTAKMYLHRAWQPGPPPAIFPFQSLQDDYKVINLIDDFRYALGRHFDIETEEVPDFLANLDTPLIVVCDTDWLPPTDWFNDLRSHYPSVVWMLLVGSDPKAAMSLPLQDVRLIEPLLDSHQEEEFLNAWEHINKLLDSSG